MWWLNADLFSFVIGEYVSCVLWSGLYHITGTDIVRALVFRFEAFGAYLVHSYYLCDSWLLIGSLFYQSLYFRTTMFSWLSCVTPQIRISGLGLLGRLSDGSGMKI